VQITCVHNLFVFVQRERERVLDNASNTKKNTASFTSFEVSHFTL